MYIDIWTKIFYDTETNIDEEIFYIVLKEFLNITDINYKFSNMTDLDKVMKIKNELIDEPVYINLLYEILNKYNYNMKYEIKNAIFALTNLEKLSKNKKTINKILTSPVIQDVSFNGKDQFTILSSQYGKFTFEVASQRFKRNKKIEGYIRKNELPHYCHQHAYFIASVFPEFYAITSLCRYYFKDIYYHSYTYDKYNNLIIDFCYNTVMNKEEYYNLFEPKDILLILNKNIDEELRKVEMNTDQPKKRFGLLKIALYKQYLEMVNNEQKQKILKL